MKLIMLLALLILAAATTTAAAQALPPQAKSGCPTHCGNLTIPYPFGLKAGCYLNESFSINCEADGSATLTERNYPVTNISLDEGELQIQHEVNRDCYNRSGYYQADESNAPELSLMPPYTISSTKNKLFAVGCDTKVYIEGYRGNNSLLTGCISYCYSNSSESLSDQIQDSCSGAGCCETPLPKGLQNGTIYLSTYHYHVRVWEFNPCSYSFVTEETQFNFSIESFEQLKKIEIFPLVLNWAIGDDPCDAAEKRDDFACKANHSECVKHNNHNGYICQCSEGFLGNPYLPHGCQDIDECKTNPCRIGTCQNLLGNYSCSCPKGYRKEGNTDCIKNNPTSTNRILEISLGIIAGFFVLLVGIFWIYCGMKRRKFKKLQDKYFKQNGGILLKQQLASYNGSVETVARIFTEEELKKATNNYHLSEKIGEGGYGTVYKGTLSDKKVVAIKKSKINAPPVQSNQFVNEVIILSQISHRNVVRLLGCCLETLTPILVYEYMTNGTLYDRIQRKGDKAGSPPLSLASRLSMAADTADALSYLHYSTSIQIIHRDVKTTNILLDGNDMAKVSDFGVSRLVPEDKDQVSTLVQGTLGYLDPEYLQSHTLTEKSDVYSFGVVLVELLTGQKVISPQKPEEERNLAKLFVCSVEKGCLDQILDKEIVKEGNFDVVEKVADLAQRCLRLRGDERPSMREVFMELEGLMRDMAKHAGGGKADFKPSPKESDHLLGSPPNLNAYFVDVKGEGDDGGSTTIFTSSTTDYDSTMQINSSTNVKTIYDAGR